MLFFFLIQMENLCEYYTCLFNTLCVVLLLLHNSQNYSNFSLLPVSLWYVWLWGTSVCTAAVQDNTTKLHFKINSLTWHAKYQITIKAFGAILHNRVWDVGENFFIHILSFLIEWLAASTGEIYHLKFGDKKYSLSL